MVTQAKIILSQRKMHVVMDANNQNPNTQERTEDHDATETAMDEWKGRPGWAARERRMGHSNLDT